jgi:predicted transcriptional regulator
MRKVAALAAVVTLSVGTLTACSGGNYCSELQNYAEAIKNLDIKDTAAVERLRSEAKKLSKSSPDDLKDDWKIVLDYADNAKAANGDAAKLTELSKNDGAKIAKASEAIAKQGKDTCKVTIAG